MKFDIQKLDAHIKKLQEIRRLATDPETASMLLEFISFSGDPTEAAAAGIEHTGELVQEVVNTKEAGFGSGLWTRARA